jgi:argininosuccinate lyase
MALWGGRFSTGPAESVAKLSRSVDFDWRLAPYDVRVNLAHVSALVSNGVLTLGNGEVIRAGLKALAMEIQAGTFTFDESDEDVHSAIERGLISKIGPIGSGIRAGRSRNDLVVTDLKLYLNDHILEIARLLTDLIEAFAFAAKIHTKTIAPGFTHLQHAQPIVFGHELAKHCQGLLRDLDRISDWLSRNNLSPFGAGAMAGSALVPSPELTAQELGFSGILENSIDAVSDRDFAAEALFIFAMIGIHLSRIGEEFTLWNSTEFGWVTIADEFSTGSSIMPQKKNPDIAELARGKAGRLVGNLTGLLTTLKGLPFAYNRDLQEDKEPLFDSVETLLVILPALTGMVNTAIFHPERISALATEGFTLATEIADFLVSQGVAFADAHETAGACVKEAEKSGLDLHELSAKTLAAINPKLVDGIRSLLNAQNAIDSRKSALGTAPTSVEKQILEVNMATVTARVWISNAQERFSGMMSQ